MYAAFYTGTRPGLAGLYNRIVRAYERGPFSHCELIFSDGRAASSSFMDHGVRFLAAGAVDFKGSGKWVTIELPDALETAALQWFTEHEGASYDLRGNFRFLFPFGNRDSRNKWFCCEALLAALGVADAWSYGVNAAAAKCHVLAQSPDGFNSRT